MKDFKYLAHGVTVPLHHIIIVFDEAQRAWDMDTKKPGENEATLLLRLGDRIAEKYGKVTILCLIGDGQAIHRHEEPGMPLWVDALSNRSNWNAYVPDSYKQLFSSVPTLHVSPELMLTTSIRHDFIQCKPLGGSNLGVGHGKSQEGVP